MRRWQKLGLGVLGLVVLAWLVVPAIWQRLQAKPVQTVVKASLAQAMVAGQNPTPSATAMPTARPTDTLAPTMTQVPATATPTQTPTRMSTNVPTATVSYSPTSSIVAVSSITSTVSMTPTAIVSGTNGLVHPEFFEGQSTGKEYRASYDVGVKEGQVGIAFGYSIEWQGRVLGYPTDKCGLVVLLPGWYEKFTLTDGRYEVYDLPNSNREFWMKDLARQRAEEQASHYGCTLKVNVPVWKSGIPAVVWSIVAPPTSVPIPTNTPTAKPTAKPVALTAMPTTNARVRTTSGKTGKTNFVKGDEVWGFKIVLDSGKSCEGGCYLPSAPSAGTVEDGVVNPWPGEVPSSVSAKPWVP